MSADVSEILGWYYRYYGYYMLGPGCSGAVGAVPPRTPPAIWVPSSAARHFRLPLARSGAPEVSMEKSDNESMLMIVKDC